MNVVLDITTRNLRLFFRDRLGVFFSLVSALVVFLLYTLFLGNLQTEGLGESFPQATEDEIRGFVDSWMFAGILGITTITTALGAMVVFVEDSGSGRFQDFLVSPDPAGEADPGLSALRRADLDGHDRLGPGSEPGLPVRGQRRDHRALCRC